MDSGDEAQPLTGFQSGGRTLLRGAQRQRPLSLCCRGWFVVPVLVLVPALLLRQQATWAGSRTGLERRWPLSGLWAAGAGDSLGASASNLGYRQFSDGAAAAAAEEECHTAVPGEHCFSAVTFAMNDGIQYRPSWYPGLTVDSPFKDFQMLLHREGLSSCDVPCDSKDLKAAANEADHAAGHAHGYLALCFLFGGLSIGCVLQVIQERLLPMVPYTCMLFVCGLLMSGIHELRPESHWSSWPTWYISVSMWQAVDPHLIFYIFLPALIFAEAMRLNIKLAMNLCCQVLLLAVSGVTMGAGLTAVFCYYILPYGWSWATCLVFGSILAATDPVAVVALFNTLGVSPRLTMLVSGESLLNDGTAIVLFTITLQIMMGESTTLDGVAKFFVQMTVSSIILGSILAAVALVLVSLCAESKYHSDSMIQVCVTICLAMLCFFVAESEVHTSGVLTVVTAGCVFSHYAWPRFASRATMHIVWEAIEFMGNTVIFLLAGLLFGHRCITRRGNLQSVDFCWLLVLYVALLVIRGIMVLVLWPLMNFCGDRISWKEAVVMVWSGLRGAVGLVLAIVVDEEPNISAQIGSHFMFHIGGIAMLTIVINATLSAPLLRALGLTRPPEVDERLIAHMEELVQEEARLALKDVWWKHDGRDADTRWANADLRSVKALLLLETNRAPTRNMTSVNDASELRLYREMYGRFVRNTYWQDIEEGLIPRTSRVARGLLYSASGILQSPTLPLQDWNDLVDMSEEFMRCPCLSVIVANVWPLSRFDSLQLIFPSDKTIDMWRAYMGLCFLHAHEAARKELPTYFAEGRVMRYSVQEKVARESREECEEAAKFLFDLPKQTVAHCQSRMLAGRLLHKQLEKVDYLAQKGLLDDHGASHISHDLQAQHRALSGMNVGPRVEDKRPMAKHFF